MRVEFSGVTLQLGGVPIIRGAHLAVESGHTVGILGANGSGKSTLLRSLYRVLRPSAGTVTVGGADVWNLPLRTVARTVAAMAQESATEFDLEVLDVVLLGRVPHRRGFGADTPQDLAIALDALDRVGSRRFERRMFSQLSGGEKQRVLLAQALAQQTPVLVLDEPTNHLDIAFQLELLQLVSSLGLTVIAALHDLNLAIAHCDEVAVLQHGVVVAVGVPDDILTPELIGDVFGVRAHRLRHPEHGGLLIAFSAGRPLPAASDLVDAIPSKKAVSS